MSNYIEYNGRITFHPGYYIHELVENSGLTQEEFAKRLDTTPKNLSILIRGEQSLSTDMALKLSRMFGTSINYWLNLQVNYDELIAEMKSEKEMQTECRILDSLGYGYFRDNFALPDCPRQRKKQVMFVRNFLKVATLAVFAHPDMAVSFRASSENLSVENIIKANVMVQIATNIALEMEAPRFDKQKFGKAVDYALTLTSDHDGFFPLLQKAFLEAGVKFVVLPNIPGSKINGAAKKVGSSILLMVNDRRSYSDTFWFTLMHECGHIMNGDYGLSLECDSGIAEDAADEFAQNKLIPEAAYNSFIAGGRYDKEAIISFADGIKRDPAIILGRLQKDGIVSFSDKSMNGMRHKYRIISAND